MGTIALFEGFFDFGMTPELAQYIDAHQAGTCRELLAWMDSALAHEQALAEAAPPLPVKEVEEDNFSPEDHIADFQKGKYED